MVNRPTDTPLDPRLEQAADWHARLQGDADQAVWLAFTEWLEADPSHRRAYDQVESLWRQVEALPAEPQAAIIDLASRRKAEPAAPANRSRRWFLGGAAAAAAALALTLTGRHTPTPLPELFETGQGQRRTVTLADGSSIILNSGTRLSVALSADRRAVVLEQGEALFDVAKDAARPFTVAAGERLVTVVGTAFNVRHLDRSVTVTVTRGLVDVGDQTGGAKVRLTPGQQISAAQGQPPGPVTTVDAQAATAWTQGRLSFDNAPLPQVLAELSRHYPLPMRAEGAAAALHFSGVLRLDADQAVLLETLQGLLPIAVVRQGDRFVLSKRP
ncbi:MULTISPECIES: FecR domain-containing protein [unclassified Azospirillum]|uniref:FecR family protein n=1 Tax=unclassified Azospirillum TaxID=2630922 RepID=UPI000B68EAE9|nr:MULTISPECIES: FecR domain-containing protein [unclassified Azospirillum]SNS40265.1 FecR family protein [Azospirillum sp. RU38E]SNS58772.1 FecR family protein [Azospirillum sp. RU37A]